jgi:hypothetical protein
MVVNSHAHRALICKFIPKDPSQSMIGMFVTSCQDNGVRFYLASICKHDTARSQTLDSVIALSDFDCSVGDQVEATLIRIMT